jgi:hypothetical protein
MCMMNANESDSQFDLPSSVALRPLLRPAPPPLRPPRRRRPLLSSSAASSWSCRTRSSIHETIVHRNSIIFDQTVC